MIEGVIIIVIVVTLVVAAILALTFWSAITAFFADLTSAVISITTGTATFLTEWFYWSIEPTNYYGWAWIITWALLMAYAAYEIATSDKGWRNAIGRRSNPLALVLCLFLIAQPFVISYGATYLADTTTSAVIDYNAQIQCPTNNPAISTYNGSYYSNYCTKTFDNDTYTVIIPSLTVNTVTSGWQFVYMTENLNSTFLSGHTVTKVVFSWYYVGTGNLTGLYYSDGTYVHFRVGESAVGWTGAHDTDLPENGTATWYPQVFEQNQLKSLSTFKFIMKWADESNKPTTGDYVEYSITFYEASTIYTAEFMMQMLATAIAAINVIAFVGLSGIYKKILKIR